MGRARVGSLLCAALLVVTGCSDGSDDDAEAEGPDTSDPTTVPAESTAARPTATSVPPSTTDRSDPARDPTCFATVVAGDSLSKVASVGGVTIEAIREENWLGDNHVIHPGDELDICIGNDVDDVTGASRLAPAADVVSRQQQKLNELFTSYRIADLAVDGDSGRLTRQMLCAARMGLGLPVAATHMAAGSPEEAELFAAESLSIPEGAAVWADKWLLIDKTCQVVFTGEGDDRIVDVYPTSTGEPDFETRDIQGVAAFRFDPALDNGGWHDSSRFPVAVDNPQNGNMYKPIYFSSGQAIHGANYVPPEPNSKGCARLFPWHQDELIAWLKLDDVAVATWRESQIGVTVTVQGDYRPAV